MSTSDKEVSDFIQALQPRRSARNPAYMVQAEVYDVDGDLTSIQVEGSGIVIEEVRKFSFTGTLISGDSVWCIKNGPEYLIVGTLA